MAPRVERATVDQPTGRLRAHRVLDIESTLATVRKPVLYVTPVATIPHRPPGPAAGNRHVLTVFTRRRKLGFGHNLVPLNRGPRSSRGACRSAC